MNYEPINGMSEIFNIAHMSPNLRPLIEGFPFLVGLEVNELNV